MPGATSAEVLEIGSDAELTIRAELERILASPEFSKAHRRSTSLRYLVEEALAGRSERLKAFTIAQDVFGRDESF